MPDFPALARLYVKYYIVVSATEILVIWIIEFAYGSWRDILPGEYFTYLVVSKLPLRDLDPPNALASVWVDRQNGPVEPVSNFLQLIRAAG